MWIFTFFFKLDFVEIWTLTETNESEVVSRFHTPEETTEILVGFLLVDYAVKVCVNDEYNAALQDVVMAQVLVNYVAVGITVLPHPIWVLLGLSSTLYFQTA